MMERHPRQTADFVEGDLLEQDVEVIVNPWNRNLIPWWLLWPQGVSGAIKRRGGCGPFRELARQGGMPLGCARLTGPGRLGFRAIIHVAGLDLLWRSSEPVVRSCVGNALSLAESHGFKSVAIPLIGAGTGGLDRSKVTAILGEEVASHSYRGEVVVVLHRKQAPCAFR